MIYRSNIHVACHDFHNIFPKIDVSLFHLFVTDGINDAVHDTSTRKVRWHICGIQLIT